jgi:hypothetical protein
MNFLFKDSNCLDIITLSPAPRLFTDSSEEYMATVSRHDQLLWDAVIASDYVPH